MASYEFNAKAGRARVFFRFGGRQFNKTVKVPTERKAEALRPRSRRRSPTWSGAGSSSLQVRTRRPSSFPAEP